MRHGLRKLLNVLLWVGSIAVLGLALHLHQANRSLRILAKTLLDARETPYIVSGLHIDLLGHTEQIDGWPRTHGDNTKNSKPKVFLIAVSNSCGFCGNSIPKWEKIISSSTWMVGSKEVWLLALEKQGLVADPIMNWLKANRIPSRMLAPKDTIAFSIYTGFKAVPATLILNENRAVNLICHGTIGDKEVDIFQKALNDDTISDRIRFLRPSVSGKTMSMLEVFQNQSLPKGELK